jgi:hypothetical protein
MTEVEETLTRLMGHKCPDCGWRLGLHRPAAEFVTACPAHPVGEPAS